MAILTCFCLPGLYFADMAQTEHNYIFSLTLLEISIKLSFCCQEPLSAALSVVNLLMHFTGLFSFYLLVKYKLPLRPQTRRTYYEYTSLWHIYAILSMNSWFWSTVFHTRYEVAWCICVKTSI
jgi:hypothetical protein